MRLETWKNVTPHADWVSAAWIRAD